MKKTNICNVFRTTKRKVNYKMRSKTYRKEEWKKTKNNRRKQRKIPFSDMPDHLSPPII
jgi:hypothetical protein